MQFVKIGKVSEFEIIKIKSFSLLGKKVGVIKRDDGSFYAIEVGCKHQGADLTNGTIQDGVATCPRHGWKYDLETGEEVWKMSGGGDIQIPTPIFGDGLMYFNSAMRYTTDFF